MSEEFKMKTYLKTQTGVVVNILEVNHDANKNEVTMVMANDEGDLIDSKFPLSGEYAKYAKANMDKVKKLTGVESLREAIGHKIGIHINLNDFTYKKGPKAGQKGVSANVAGYFKVEKTEEVFEPIPF